MATKQERLTTEAIEVLRRYAPGKSLSTAILLMDKEVTTCNSNSVTMSHPSVTGSTFSLQSVTSEDWMLFEAHVRRAISKEANKPSWAKADKATADAIKETENAIVNPDGSVVPIEKSKGGTFVTYGKVK